MLTRLCKAVVKSTQFHSFINENMSHNPCLVQEDGSLWVVVGSHLYSSKDSGYSWDVKGLTKMMHNTENPTVDPEGNLHFDTDGAEVCDGPAAKPCVAMLEMAHPYGSFIQIDINGQGDTSSTYSHNRWLFRVTEDYYKSAYPSAQRIGKNGVFSGYFTVNATDDLVVDEFTLDDSADFSTRISAIVTSSIPTAGDVCYSSAELTTGSTATVSTTGSDTVWKFTSTGSCVFAKDTACDVLLVGGGGGGASGGGGAGECVYHTGVVIPAGGYAVTVGGGGAYGVSTTSAGNGDASLIGSLYTAIGGGYGGNDNSPGQIGGSGGGAGQNGTPLTVATGVAGNGNNGGQSGIGAPNPAAGGGGWDQVGGDASGSTGGSGGNGKANSITGSSVTYGGGGGGAVYFEGTPGGGGSGGGGAGKANNTAHGDNGTANTGGGGGGVRCVGGSYHGGTGGSGVVIIRLPTANASDTAECITESKLATSSTFTTSIIDTTGTGEVVGCIASDRDSVGNTLVLYYTKNNSTNAIGNLRYGIKAYNGSTWAFNDIPSDKLGGSSNYTSEYTIDVLGLDLGFVILYTRLNSSSKARVYTNTIQVNGVVSTGREIFDYNALTQVYGAYFFKPNKYYDVGTFSPDLPRSVKKPTFYSINNVGPVRAAAIVEHSQVPSVYAVETVLLSDVAFPTTPSEQMIGSSMDFLNSDASGVITSRYIKAFNKFGSKLSYHKYSPLPSGYINGKSSYSQPEDFVFETFIDPQSYNFPTRDLSAQDQTSYIEQDIRSIYISPSGYLDRTYLVNSGNLIKRTVWTVDYFNNEYEVSQVVPKFLDDKICYYQANAYVIGPSRDPWEREVLQSET